MTSQGIVSVEWQLCMLLTMMTVVPACSSCNVCLFYFFFILSVFFLGMIWVFVLACHCKNVLSVKSSPFLSKGILLTPCIGHAFQTLSCLQS